MFLEELRPCTISNAMPILGKSPISENFRPASPHHHHPLSRKSFQVSQHFMAECNLPHMAQP